VGQNQTLDTVSYSYAFSKKKDFSLLVGYNQGDFGFADVGFAINNMELIVILFLLIISFQIK
jgi:hypothetical protein